jgi:hypothetical protein
MFEQRILCHKLSNSFNSIKIHNSQEACPNKRNKMIQDLKRQMLYTEVEQYELKIQYYEHLYEQELVVFESEIHKTKSLIQMAHSNELMHYVTTYLYHHTKLLMGQIRYKESYFHVKLLRHRRRHLHRQCLKSNKTINVYPQTIVDIPNVALNQTLLDYLSITG